MQIYSVALAIPANTPETNPVVKRIRLLKGTLRRVLIHFPPGASALAHIRAFLDDKQILPDKNEGDVEDSIALDDATFPLILNKKVEKREAELRVEGWNEDDTYPHTIKLIFSHQLQEEGG